MADVRSLLRQERAARQQSARTSAAPAAAPSSKKRKAADTGLEERKKTRTAGPQAVPADFYDDASHEPQIETEQLDVQQPEAQESTAPAQPVDEDDAELDAFMKEIAEAPQQRPGPTDFFSGAVIEAAPMTAAEVAAQAREEQSAQRGKKEEELEAEKEDAAQQLQDEFDEMELLEERVRKLREKREALRKARVQATAEDIVIPDAEPAGVEDEESESDDEDWDDWRFRPA